MLTDTPVLILLFITLLMVIATSIFCILVQIKEHKLDTLYTTVGVLSTVASFAICYGLNSQIAPAAIYVG
jgi:hypothetical protein